MPDPDHGRSAKETTRPTSLVSCAIKIVLVELAVLAVALLLRSRGIVLDPVPVTVLGGAFFTVTIAMLGGLVFSKFPRGKTRAFTRLGLATFCRTGLPLLAVMAIAKYLSGRTKTETIFFVVMLYAAGHVSTVVLAAWRNR